MKRALSSLLVFALVLTLLVPAFAFAADKTTEEKFNELKEKGLLNGVEDGSAALDRELTRAELAAILVRLLKLEPITGQSSFIDVPADHWAQKEGVIEAVAKAGLMGSTTTYSKTFSPDAKLTIAEVAKVAVSALKLTVDENAKVDGVQPWAAPYVAAALKAGVIAETKDYHAKANRGILVDAAYVIYNTILVPPVTTATKVESVSADNLLEVNIKFDGQVDEFTATDVDNYTIAGKTLDSASLSADGTVVTLTLKTNSSLTNQTAYKLSFNNVKAGDKVLSVSNYQFTPVDAALPVATKAEALGNKTVKVTFSEPVKNVSTANFLIDGKTVLGYPTVSKNVAVLKLNSALTNEEHKITVKGVEDYSGLKSLSTDLSFTVVEDTVAPTVAEVVKATFETVVLKFSETVDPSTVKVANIYWKQGATKKLPASVTPVSDDTFSFDFSNNKIQFTTDLYVTGVKDYSGNTIAADTKVLINPTLDTSNPEVVNVTVESSSEFTVKFNKRLDKASAEKASNYVFRNADGKEVSKLKTVTQSSTNPREVTIKLIEALSEGKTYTLEITGVRDNTTLNNLMIPYSKSITIDDESAPTVLSVKRSVNNTIVVTYSEAMDVGGDGSIVDQAKYMYEASGKWNKLPSSTLMNVTDDGKSALLTFPDTVNVNNVTKVRVMLVKDLAGNYIDPLTNDYTVGNAVNSVVQSVYAVDNTTIWVNFDQSILASTVNLDDFTVKAGSSTYLNVIGASLVKSNRVALTLSDDSALNDDATFGKTKDTVAVSIVSNPATSTPDGKPVVGSGIVNDSIAATVYQIKGSPDGTYVDVVFNEGLDNKVPVASVAGDFVVTDNDGNVLRPGTDYTVSYQKSDSNSNVFDVLRITFTSAQKGIMTVETISAPRYTSDAIGNLISAFEATEVAPDLTQPTATAALVGSDVVITFSENMDTNTFVAANFSSVKGGTVTVKTYTAKTVTLTFTNPLSSGDAVTISSAVKDLAGNSVQTTEVVLP